MMNAKYDWESWFERNRFVLKPGRHFDVPPARFAAQIRNNASRRGLSVSVESIESGEFIVTVKRRGGHRATSR